MTSEDEKFHTTCLLYGMALGTVLGAAGLELSSVVPAWKNAISGGSVGFVGGGMAGAIFGHGVRYLRLTREFYNASKSRETPSVDQTDKPDVEP